MKPTPDELRKLLGAPCSEEASPSPPPTPVEPSSRPVWTKPVPKLVAASVLLLPVFGIAGAFLIRGQSNSNQPQLPISTEPQINPVSPEDSTEQLRQENANLKAKAALEGQNRLDTRLATQNQQKPNRGAQKPSLKTPKNPTSTAKRTPSSSIAVHSTPPKLIAAPLSRPEPVATRSGVSDRSKPAKQSSPTDPVQAEQRWQQLAQLGSYGGASIQPEWSTTDHQSEQATLDSKVAIRSSPQLATLEIRNSTHTEAQERTSPSIPESPSAHATKPPILEEAESRILNASPSQTMVVAGSTSSGIVATSLILDEEQSRESERFSNRSTQEQFTVVLTQPLKDERGAIVMPANTHLVVQVDQVSSTGRIRSSAIAAHWNQNGVSRSLQLPANAIQIQGKNGQPLVAHQTSDPEKEIAALDTQQFLLGAVRGAAEQLTSANTRVETGNGTTVITQNKGNSNLIAGALKGGTDSVLSAISQRNQRAIDALKNRPIIRSIEAGETVQVFVNQPIQISS